MSSCRYGWWGYVKDMLRRYPNKNTESEKAAILKAIEETNKMDTGKDRLRVIELVYFKGTKTLAGAALDVHCSERQVLRYHGDFIRLVAKNFKCDNLFE